MPVSITPGLNFVAWNAPTQDLATAPFKGSLSGVFAINTNRNGFVSFRPSSNFPAITQVVNKAMYLFLVTARFDLPEGATLVVPQGAVAPGQIILQYSEAVALAGGGAPGVQPGANYAIIRPNGAGYVVLDGLTATSFQSRAYLITSAGSPAVETRQYGTYTLSSNVFTVEVPGGGGLAGTRFQPHTLVAADRDAAGQVSFALLKPDGTPITTATDALQVSINDGSTTQVTELAYEVVNNRLVLQDPGTPPRLSAGYVVSGYWVSGGPSPGGTTYDDTQLRQALTQKADLENGMVPARQLPSYVDDVLSFAGSGLFPVVGETGKIYLAENTNRQYRWASGTYALLSDSGLTSNQLNAIQAGENPSQGNEFTTKTKAAQLAQDALNTAPLIVVNAYNNLVRTDFTKMYDASLFSCQNDSGTNGGYGGYGGYFAINRPLALTAGDHFAVNIDGILDLQNQPLNLNGGWIDIHPGGRIINNRLIYNGQIRLRDLRAMVRPASISGGVITTPLRFTDQGSTTLILDDVRVSRMNYLGLTPSNYMTDATPGGRLTLRNGSGFDGCAPDPATTITADTTQAVLPPITPADEGKILQVVNGRLALVA